MVDEFAIQEGHDARRVRDTHGESCKVRAFTEIDGSSSIATGIPLTNVDVRIDLLVLFVVLTR